MTSSFAITPILFLLCFISPSRCQTPFQPHRLVLPVTKDSSTQQYLTQINQRTPLVPVKLTIDLGGQFLWVDCEQDYVSSSYRPILCGSPQCSTADSKGCANFSATVRPGSNLNTCFLCPDNTIRQAAFSNGELAEDVVSIQSSNPGQAVLAPQFLFSCAPTSLLENLASGVKGMAGLGRTKIALPSQFGQTFRIPRRFAVCLSSSVRSKGVILFGDGPYVLLPNIDISKSLTYTPLIINPVCTASAFCNPGEPSTEYFIRVRSIKINGVKVPLNKTLLSIDKEGYGGTKISTVRSYTYLESSIYKALTRTFIRQLSSIKRVKPVAPFGVCFESENIGSTRVGPAVPPIDFVLQNENVYWRIFGANSMVQVSEEVMCLGFIDGGVKPVAMTAIVIGGHQLEDNLLQFDLARSRLGFSSSLLFQKTTCANFNFTSSA